MTYSGSDLDDAAGNQVTQFTRLVDVSGSSTAEMPPPMGSPDIGSSEREGDHADL